MTPRWKRACLPGRRSRPARDRVVPDWAQLHQELKKPGVTLALLWLEYRGAHPDGYAYSQFCERYRQWARRAEAVDAPGASRRREALCRLSPASGRTWSIRRPARSRPVELFVGVLGASGLIYAEATPGQDLPSWIGAHVGMLEYFQGSAAIWVPDNLKSGVTTANRYEPEINRTYAELARHYGAVVIPARVARPTDKPKVEVSVQIAQRWVLAALRHRTFFTLADLNAAIGERVDAINDRPMKATGVSRRALFEQLDRPGAQALAAHALRAGGVEAVSREHRLSRRGRSQLLQRAVSARARARRGALHGRRTVEVFCQRPSGRLARRGSPAAAGFPRRLRSHAAGASRARRMDAVAAHRVGGPERPGHRPTRRRHPRRTGRIPSKATARAWA